VGHEAFLQLIGIGAVPDAAQDFHDAFGGTEPSVLLVLAQIIGRWTGRVDADAPDFLQIRITLVDAP
jgi:hypothetical protein